MYLHIGLVNLMTQITNELSMVSYQLKDGKHFISSVFVIILLLLSF